MKKSHKEIATVLIDSVFQQVKEDLIKGKMNISQDIKNLLPSITKSRVSRQQQKRQQNLNVIFKKRKQLQKQLQRLKHDEIVAKEKKLHSIKQSCQQKNKYFKSTLTSDQRHKINQIIQQSKKFQQISTKKVQQLERKIKILQKQQQKNKQIQNKLLLQKRQNQVKQKLKEIQIRKNLRSKQIKDMNKQFQRISRLKFLHHKIQQKWKIMQKAEEYEIFQRNLKSRKEKQFDLQQIRNHARRYSEIMNTHKEKRQQNISRLREDLLQHSRLVKYHHSTFFKTISLQESMKKHILAEKIRQNQILKQKKVVYAQTVRQRHKSNFNDTKKPMIQSSHKNDIRSSRSLGNLQLNKLGNLYMNQIHSCIDTVAQQQFSSNLINQNEQKISKYSDYLTQARLLKKQKNLKEEPLQIKQLKNIIKRKSEDKKVNFQNAKKIIEKMDQKYQKSSKNLIKIITAKISIIQEFSEHK